MVTVGAGLGGGGGSKYPLSYHFFAGKAYNVPRNTYKNTSRTASSRVRAGACGLCPACCPKCPWCAVPVACAGAAAGGPGSEPPLGGSQRRARPLEPRPTPGAGPTVHRALDFGGAMPRLASTFTPRARTFFRPQPPPFAALSASVARCRAAASLLIAEPERRLVRGAPRHPPARGSTHLPSRSSRQPRNPRADGSANCGTAL